MDDLLSKVKIELGTNFVVDDDTINYYIEKCTNIACETCGYTTLPNSFAPYIISAVVESISRRENEGNSSKSALGVSTTFAYPDIEESLRKKLRGKRNPLNLVGRYE